MSNMMKTTVLSILLSSSACFMNACGVAPLYDGHGDVLQALPAVPRQGVYGWDTVGQGTVGDCGLVATLSALAAYDQATLGAAMSSYEVFGLTLQIGTDSVDVTMVDVPDSVRSTPLVEVLPTWGFLVQGAFIKWNDATHRLSDASGDTGIVGTYPGEIFRLLAPNATAYTVVVADSTRVWDYLTLRDTPMVAGTWVSVTRNDIKGSHYYTVLGAGLDASGARVVRIRNPWGMQGLQVIPYEDFLRNFDLLTFIK